MLRKLYQPIQIGPIEVKNRICMPAFGLNYAENRHCTQRTIDFYEARAAGGCGLIIVGGIGIDLVGSGVIMPTIEGDEYIPGYQKLADTCHRYGARVMLQLFHAGRYSFSMLIEGQQSVSASAVSSRYTREEPRALSVEEILEIEEKFAAAAVRAKQAGVDGVEIIASAGYLICQFLSPLVNKRDDEYGGSFENRTRFPREVIEKVRERVGQDFAVTIRVSGSDFIPGSHTNKESAQACRVFEQAGVDAINVTGGWHETRVPQLPMAVPPGAFTYLAGGIKRLVSVPVMASNRITDPRQADKILREGLADMVCIGRAQIADPEWAQKGEEDRWEEIRPCVGCLQGCMDRLFSGQPLSCLTNPQAGLEKERALRPAAAPKKVVVVGAGPAGLEAACTAARQGHRVTLIEKQKSIGGQLPLAAAPPGRQDFISLLPYYRGQLKKLGIDLKLGKEATVRSLKKRAAEVLILATGAEPLLPEIPGIDLPRVCTAWEVLREEVDLGRKVVVIGGGAVGVETALYIAAQGTISAETLKFLLMHEAEDFETLRDLCRKGTREVTLIEQLPKLGQDVGITSRWVLLKEIEFFGVKSLTESKVKEIRPGEVVYEKNGNELSELGDSVVLALGSRPANALAEALTRAGVSFKQIGDCREPGKVIDAIHEGFTTAQEL